MSAGERDDDAPAVPAPAEPEEPQTSVHEQPMEPVEREPDGGAEGEDAK